MRLFLAALLTAGAVNAADATDVDQAMDDYLCAAQAQLAEAVMTKRQEGVPLVEALAKVSERSREIVLSAYEVPGYATPELQAMAVREFRDEAALRCHRQ